MNLTRSILSSVAVISVVFFISGGIISAIPPEHPEHPTTSAPKPKPEVTTDMIAEAITNYIQKDAALKGGYFLVYDKKAEKPLALKLSKVHRDKLSKVDKNLYFACTDLQEKGGQMYDLDFFLTGDVGGLEVSEVSIHKEQGNPRYTWYQSEDGTWKKK